MSKVPFSISLLSPFVLVTILGFPLELLPETEYFTPRSSMGREKAGLIVRGALFILCGYTV
jgi:hypothetical protein